MTDTVRQGLIGDRERDRGLLGRAALLRWMEVNGADDGPFVLDEQGSTWFGYEVRPAPAIQATPVPEPVAIPPAKPPTTDAGTAPLQLEQVWAVVEQRNLPESEERPELVEEPVAPALPRLSPRVASEVGGSDLVPWPRLMPVLQRRLSLPARAGIDVPALCDRAAKLLPMSRLPLRQRSRWRTDVVVVLDFSRGLRPYFWDFLRLCRQLRDRLGEEGVSLRVMPDGPDGKWREWQAGAGGIGRSGWNRTWVMPRAGSLLLLATDLGAFSGSKGRQQDWLEFAQAALRAGVTVEALVPLGASQVPSEAAALFPVLRWSPDSALRPQAAAHEASGAQSQDAHIGSDLDELLALMAPLRRVDPALLRELRKMLPQSFGNAGIEGLAWNHADVDAQDACWVRTDASERHLRHLELSVSPESKRRLAEVRKRYHRHFSEMLGHEEVVALAAASGLPESRWPEIDGFAQAQEFLAGFARWLVAPQHGTLPDDWRGALAESISRVPSAVSERFSQLYEPLLAGYLLSREGEAGSQVALPSWARLNHLERWLTSAAGPATRYWIVEDRTQSVLCLQPRPPSLGQRALALPFDASRVTVRRVPGAPVHGFHLAGQVIPLCTSDSSGAVHLASERQEWTIAPLRRPFGIEGWSARHTQAESRPPNGVISVHIQDLRGETLDLEPGYQFRAPSAGDADGRFHLTTPNYTSVHRSEPAKGQGYEHYGLDEYGVYVVLDLAGTPQRLRHLPPGRFLMGSLATEPGRDDDEGPQHEVTLTRGFWLADTCCTQALWQAVMGGKNPSRFTGDLTLPVDNVSWDDVQTFLGRLLRQLPPGVEAVLPTEAQWEYACRAGTQTPFSFGDTLTPEQANFSGNLRKTVPVKSLPANPWGLYEMHGNLLEWCVDAQRKYRAEPVEDPDGGQGGVRRVLRGGAWYGVAWNARSAYRNRILRDVRRDDFGFRFALRSIEPSAGGGIPGRAEPARVLPQVEPGAGVGPAEPGPRAEGIWSRVTGLFKGRK